MYFHGEAGPVPLSHLTKISKEVKEEETTLNAQDKVRLTAHIKPPIVGQLGRREIFVLGFGK